MTDDEPRCACGRDATDFCERCGDPVCDDQKCAKVCGGWRNRSDEPADRQTLCRDCQGDEPDGWLD